MGKLSNAIEKPFAFFFFFSFLWLHAFFFFNKPPVSYLNFVQLTNLNHHESTDYML